MNIWSDTLEADLAWRESELGSLKLMAASEAKESVRYRALLRALWCLLYAHYEGFFKFSWDYYLDVLQKLEVPRKDAIDELAQFSLKKAFRGLKSDLSDTALWKHFTNDFDIWMSEKMKFEVGLETGGNLSPSIARETHLCLGLPCFEIDSGEIQLKALVDRRNEIAHGKPLVIKTLDDYQQYELTAVRAMHELALAILDSLESKKYLKSNTLEDPGLSPHQTRTV